jgi:hypothetical protein
MTEFPRLIIPVKEHKMGKVPYLEFEQGDYVFPWRHEENGDIVVIRDNYSIGRFRDMEMTVRHAKP